MIRDKAIPLYYHLATSLERRIRAGEFPPGSPLPSEEALAKAHEVSRITVRQALSRLEQEGYIARHRGKGTFVHERPGPLEPARLTGSIEDLISIGIRTTTKILQMSMIEAGERIRDSLKLGEKEQVLRIEKVRLVEDEPLSYVVNYLPSAIGEKIRASDLAVKPLLMILEENMGMRPAQAVQTVEATIADAVVAPLLRIKVGDPLLKVERTVFDIHRRPLEHVSVLYRADKYFFTVRLKRQRGKRSRVWADVSGIEKPLSAGNGGS